MFAVTPKTDCPHLPAAMALDGVALDAIDVHVPCNRCHDKNENWICLTCAKVSCSRHVHGHAAEHYHDTKHSVSASFSDFSFWCYDCESYVVHKALERVKAAMHRSKFPDGASTGAIHHDQANTSESNGDEEGHDEENGDGSDDGSHDPTDSPPSDDFIIPPTELMKTILGMGGRPPQIAVPPPPHVLPSLDLEGIAAVIRSGKCKNIVVCTGAGISVAAGIPDFRSPGTGLYDNLQKYNLPHPTAVFDIDEHVASIHDTELDYFRQRPEPFYTLAKELYPGNFRPTHCHYFVKLLHQKGLLVRNFTQNIDTLERIAGVPEEKLVEAHGSFASAHCIACRQEYSQEFVRKAVYSDQLPRCTACNELVKPDITFFGEQLPKRFYDCVMGDFGACDLLIVIGTSLQVQPFASLISFADKRVPRLLINREKVARYNPLMALLGGPADGFLFDETVNYRDVYCGGEIQDNIKQLAALIGWGDELERLVAEGHATVPAAAAKSP